MNAKFNKTCLNESRVSIFRAVQVDEINRQRGAERRIMCLNPHVGTCTTKLSHFLKEGVE